MTSAFAQITIPDEPISILGLGDSYTYAESVATEGRWAEQLADSLEKRGVLMDTIVDIVAVTGWRTDNLANGIKEKEDELQDSYSLVGLLIGVNNLYQGRSLDVYKVEFEELLKTALSYADNDTNRVFVISIPDYAYTPFGGGSESVSIGIDTFNAVNLEITESYNVPYVDITPISREGFNDTELVATDGLHPSAKQYSLWVSEILKQTNISELTNIISPTIITDHNCMIWDILGKKVYEGNINNFEGEGLYIVEQNNARTQMVFQ
ncbi:MAG: SGNH/GDSL hydrolase family protein [Cytophagales bacterium]|nr:SGNH/GDSL hydrolase family protein [Cytophagales bacterium]